ncbi:MAG: biotin--[acetyl-CoA-carboxylase] ligase [Flavitalea sp.]
MFAQTFSVGPLREPFIIVSTVQSTNNYAMAKLNAEMVLPGTCILAVEQTAGKGQRGRQWQAEPGQNITMSIVVPAFHHLSYPFLESAILAMCCYDFIKDEGAQNLSVKWPNDIYIGDRKAAGILIENVFRGSEWRSSIAGIGINVNQTAFGGTDKAISLKHATGKHFEVIGLGKRLHSKIMVELEASKTQTAEQILFNYNSKLYKRGAEVRLKKGARVFSTTITGVSLSGELLTTDTLDQRFSVGEVEFT